MLFHMYLKILDRFTQQSKFEDLKANLRRWVERMEKLTDSLTKGKQLEAVGVTPLDKLRNHHHT